jgi:hypothetical protein
MDQNPPDRGINWISSLEIAYRAIAWCWVWHLTREAPAWNDEVLPRFLWQLWHHARHIERYDSIHHSPNTHLTGEALGLLYVGLLFPEFRRSSRWVDVGLQLLVSELDHQMLSDGMHFERAVGYHRHTVGIYLHGLLLARTFSLPAAGKLEVALRAMLSVSFALERPDGSWPIIGDEDSGTVLGLTTSHLHDQRPLLAAGAALLREADWVTGLDDAARAAGWWLLPRADWDFLQSVEPSALGSSARLLRDAGYCVVREAGPRAWYCLVDGGPHGGDRTGHAHTDLAHVEIACGELTIVCDPGSSSYTSDLEVRDRERSEAAHACLVLSDTPLAVPRGPFSWRTVSPDPELRCEHALGSWRCTVRYRRRSKSGELGHVRDVVLMQGFGVLVCDRLEGSLTEPAALHWPLPHDPRTLSMRDDGLDGAGFAVSWTCAGGDLPLRPVLQGAHFSPSYGETRPGSHLSLELGSTPPVVIATAFTSAPSRIQISSATPDAVTLEVVSSDERVRVILGDAGSATSVVAVSTRTSETTIR